MHFQIIISSLSHILQRTRRYFEVRQMSKISERLLERLRGEPKLVPLINEGVSCKRNFPSGSARNAGAWSWEIQDNNPPIGSQFSMRDCLTSAKLSIWKDPHINFYHIDPIDIFKR